MAIALITMNPYALVPGGIYSDGTSQIRLPSGDVVDGAQVGWTGEGYALAEVAPFVPPTGQQITGAPTYAIDGSGNVTETYATMPLPPPPITTIQIVSTSRRQPSAAPIRSRRNSNSPRSPSTSWRTRSSPTRSRRFR